MEFEENDESDNAVPKTSIVPPLKKTSNAVRFRILTLVAMLCMVFYAMVEAGKPENWEWMGFDKVQPSVKKKSTTDLNAKPAATSKISIVPNASKTFGDSSSSKANASPQNAGADIEKIKPDFNSLLMPSNDNEEYPKVAVDFWRSIIDKMNSVQQNQFFRMIHSMRHHRRLDDAQQAKAKPLIKVIGAKRDRFHEDIFDQVALATEGSDKKKNLSDQLFESKQLWDKNIFPAFNSNAAGEDITLSELQAVHRLQKAIDPIIFSQVLDETAFGWSGDKESWKRIWEYAIGSSSGAINNEFKPATRIQLLSQPEFYRGKPVKIAGWIRSAKRVTPSKDSEIGISEYYEAWVRPKESKLGPHCVYLSSIPEGFPELTDQFQELNEQVELEAYFFKVRTYVAGDKSVQNAPTLIASGMTRIAPVEFTSVSKWQPSRTTLIFAFILIPIVATLIAISVYNFSRTKAYQPGKKTANNINKSLQMLASDPLVQTDKEKILGLYDPEQQSNESN